MTEDSLVGCLLGTAVGDALGLPYEGLSPRRRARLFRDVSQFHFLLRRGMVSDDTEHACFVAQALIAARGELDRFERHLARALRLWLLGVPAGVGSATLRAILKLWLGVPPGRSGVRSAGNGPAMRSPILGAALAGSPGALRSHVARSTRLTHSDPKAYLGALTAALAAACSAQARTVSPSTFVQLLAEQVTGEESDAFVDLIDAAAESAETGESVADFAPSIGSHAGISGYVCHTVPCVVQVWLRHQSDFENGLLEIVSAGGDTDTTAAILGGIVGSRVGKEGIPTRWLTRIVEWPRSPVWIEELGHRLARALAGDQDVEPPRCPVFATALRNALFAAVVLGHGLRRLAPPY